MKLSRIAFIAAFWGCQAESPRQNSKAALPAASQNESKSSSDSAILAGPMGKSIQRGRALLIATKDSLPQNVGSGLSCSSCHLDAGLRKGGLLLAGAYGRYPQYRTRTGGVITIESRINDCFQRSLNGKAIAQESTAMTDLVAYLWFISRGIPVDGHVAGQGVEKLSVTSGDSTRGQAIFGANCATCHGAKGEGSNHAPPLWGAHSFNIGAAMARPQTISSFVRFNMPLDRPGVLSDQQAMDVGTYIDTRLRPDFAGKENDWPKGGAPPDVPYHLKSSVQPDPPASTVSLNPSTPAQIKSSCPGTGLWAVCSIERRLRQSGFVAQKLSAPSAPRAGFSVQPIAYTLGKSRLEVYLYDDVKSLRTEIGRLDTVKVTLRGATIVQDAAPVFIRSENLIALLYTDDSTQAERLSLAITAGAPQPGASR